jgi:E3 ubiquitin-protein ligase BRE1
MLEYKREKNNLEARLHELESKADDHDEHIRVIDAWWLQVRLVCLGTRKKPY